MNSFARVVHIFALLGLWPGILAAETRMLTFRQGDGGAHSQTDGATVGTMYNVAGGGSSTRLRAESIVDIDVSRAYLRFPDIIGNKPGQIPLGSAITSASLMIMRATNSSYPGLLSLVDGAWDEDTINKGNAPGTMAGGGGQIPAGAAGHYSTIDVTAALVLWVGDVANGGWRISPGWVMNGSGIDQQFYSDDATLLETRPSLIVTFTPPPAAVESATWGKVKALYR